MPSFWEDPIGSTSDTLAEWGSKIEKSKPSDWQDATSLDLSGLGVPRDSEIWKTVANDDTLSTILTAVASYYGGPFGAALANSALARERGAGWGQSAGAGAKAYAASSLARGAGGGSEGSAAGGAEAGAGAGAGTEAAASSTGSGLSSASSVMDAGNAAGSSVNWWKTGSQLAGSLYDAHQKQEQARQLRERYDQLKRQIDAFYGPNSPEAMALRDRMERLDAKAGRNSQYGRRETDLAASIAQARMNASVQAAPQLNQLLAASNAVGGSSMNSLFSFLGNKENQEALASLF